MNQYDVALRRTRDAEARGICEECGQPTVESPCADCCYTAAEELCAIVALEEAEYADNR